jgi:hypothetical protein
MVARYIEGQYPTADIVGQAKIMTQFPLAECSMTFGSTRDFFPEHAKPTFDGHFTYESQARSTE